MKTDVLKNIFSFLRQAKSRQELIEFAATSFNVSSGDAEDFVQELFDRQIIRCLQEPNITGREYIERMELFRDIASEKESKEDTRSAYINMLRGTEHCLLSTEFQDRLRDGLFANDRLVAYEPSDQLQRFKEKFRFKFDGRVVPLMEALDPETGIDYYSLTDTIKSSALMDNVAVSGIGHNQINISWGKLQALLMRKWPGSAGSTINLTREELMELPPADQSYKLPNTASIVFRTIGKDVFIESAGNASANALIGRFSLLHPDFLTASKTLSELEEQANPDVAFAEIAHFSDLHVSNIERRACFYNYEIPLVTGSEYDDEHRIALSDLVVFLSGNDLILYSVTLKKRIIPRLSSALNYNKSDLSVFRFLCDLQHQGLKTMFTFHPEMYFPDLDFYPRITYNHTILSLASWNIRCTHDCPTITSVKALLSPHALPRYVSCNQGDNQLIFDLTVDADLLLFASFFKKGKTLHVKEFPFAESTNAAVRDLEGRPYTHQFIASIYHNKPLYDPIMPAMHDTAVQRTFVPGSDWLYLKLYCLPMRSNRILTDYIAPLLRVLRENYCITGFFFIRYNDPSHHLRIRFRLSDNFQTGTIIKAIESYLKPALDNQFVEKYEYDTYEREIERYHPSLIEEVERFFCANAEFVLNFLLENPSLDDGETGYFQIAFAGVQDILYRMGKDAEENIRIFETLFFSFAAEFKMTPALKKDLSAKYRKWSEGDAMQDLLCWSKSSAMIPHLGPWYKAIDSLSHAILLYSDEEKSKLITDLIHMHLNRCFISEPRKHELVFYYCMNKYYMSASAKMRRSSSSVA